MTKTICKAGKEKKRKIREKNPKYTCKSCKEKAHKEKYLCKPVRH